MNRRGEKSAHFDSPLISKLGDDLLEEILIRIPDPRSAVQCKTVSKRWRSVVSNPYFFRRCIDLRRQQSAAAAAAADDPIPPCPEHVRRSISSFLRVSDMVSRDKSDARGRFRVWNCAEDDSLFLCGFEERHYSGDELSRSFFVCNRRTEQWIDLPLSPAPPRAADGDTVLLPTLVCEPSNFVNLDLGDGETFVYPEYRFRVLRMHRIRANRNPRLDVYCSESGEWTSHDVGDEVHRLYPYKTPYAIRVLKGKLYWMHPSERAVVEFDPFHLDRTPRVFDASAVFPAAAGIKFSRGVWFSGGHLHIVSLSPTSLSVWQWQGEELGWTRQCEVTMDMLNWCSDNKKKYEDSFGMELCGENRSDNLFGKLCDKCEGGKMDPEVELKLDSIIGLHPADPQVVYLGFDRPNSTYRKKYSCSDNYFCVVCNLHKGTLELFAAMYQYHSGARWTAVFEKPRLASSYWPAQIRNFGKLGGKYDGRYLSINPPAGSILD